MANATLGNKIYVDTTGTVSTKRLVVAYIVITASSPSSVITFREEDGGQIVMVLDVATTGTTQVFDFSRTPLVFNNGIHVTIDNAGDHVTIVTTTAGGSQ